MPVELFKNNIKEIHVLLERKKIKTRIKIDCKVKKKTIKKGWLKKTLKKIFTKDKKIISFISGISRCISILLIEIKKNKEVKNKNNRFVFFILERCILKQ